MPLQTTTGENGVGFSTTAPNPAGQSEPAVIPAFALVDEDGEPGALLKALATAAAQAAVEGAMVSLSVDLLRRLRVAVTDPDGDDIDFASASEVKGAISDTSTSSNVSAAAADTLLLAANADRLGGGIVNDSTAILYVKLGSGASSTSYDYFLAGSVSGVPAQFEIPFGWTGPIYGRWASATGAARVHERVA